MGADFYPRLTAAIHDQPRAVRIVNEQTEVGILLALPGLLGTLAFAPLMMELFYTKRFLAGAELLPWFVLGIFGRIVSWPLGFIQLSKGASRWFIATETVSVTFQLGLLLWLVPRFGVLGAPCAFAITYFAYTIVMLWVSFVLVKFKWSQEVKLLLLLAAILILAGAACQYALSGWQSTLAGSSVVLLGAIVSARGLADKLGLDSSWLKWVHVKPSVR
jgi:antigen flippase